MYLRQATIEDAELLLSWANDPIVRQNSFNTHKISKEEHYAWFNRVLESKDIAIYILCDNKPVGTVRIQYRDKSVLLSYSIDAKSRGKGYGTQIIRLAEIEVVKHHTVEKILAEVKFDNFASCHIFQKLAYEESCIDGHFLYVKKIKRVIGFRVDSNKEVATGHAMRCITYAKQLIKQGTIVIFFVADDESAKFIELRGMYCVVLNSAYNKLEQETNALIANIKTYHIKTLVIDSYYVTDTYLQAIRKETKIVYIDDVLNFAYPVDVLVNYNIYADKSEYKQLYANAQCPLLLLGMEYAPLREEFKNVKYVIRPEVKNILITMGGGDHYNIAQKLVEYLLPLKEFSDITFHIVAGEFFECNILDNKVKVHKNVSDMAQLMSDCNLIVSAGGFTLYEAYTVGVPTISVSFADNQLKNVRKFDELGLIPYMGDFRDDEQVVIKNIVFYLRNSCKSATKKL